MADRDDHAEILRARDRLHRLEAAVAANTMRVQALQPRMDKVEVKVEALARADEIAGAVADKLHERRAQLFTVPQKVAAALVGAVAVADFVRGVVIG